MDKIDSRFPPGEMPVLRFNLRSCRMRLITAPAFLLFLSIAFAQSDRTGEIRRLDGSHISFGEAEAFAQSTLAEAHVTGAEIAVLDRGKLVWSGAFGLRHKNPDQPMTLDTTTWAASITKSVFTTYVMTLVERGEFDLDTPIARQLPQPLDTYEPYKLTASEIVKDPAWQRVTPRMLLSHSSGLANFAFVEPDKKLHFHSAPGSSFLYSGEGFNLVQFVIEQKKGRSLDELMQEAVFAPLRMQQTGLVYHEEFGTNVSDRFGAAEQFLAQTRRGPSRAAGSMTTSMSDLVRFTEAFLGGKIVSAKERRAMMKPVLKIHSDHLFPRGPNEKADVDAERVGLAYGLGWGLLTHTRYGPAFFKEGHGDGAENYMICFSKRASCIILLTNSDNGELTFRPLMEHLLGNTETPWEWEGYTPSSRETQ